MISEGVFCGVFDKSSAFRGLLRQKLFRGKDDELSVLGRLAAGACAGMTSTLVSLSLCLCDLFFGYVK